MCGGTYRGQWEAVVQEVGVPPSGLTDAVFVGRWQPSRQGCVGSSPPGVVSVETNVRLVTVTYPTFGKKMIDELDWKYQFKEQKEMGIFLLEKNLCFFLNR